MSGYPPQQGGYYPQAPPQGYPPQGYPPPDGGYPPQGYPPQGYPPPQQQMQYQQAPPPKEEKSHGCLYTWVRVIPLPQCAAAGSAERPANAASNASTAASKRSDDSKPMNNNRMR
ncbi:hypothetical protein QBC40DRAFT_255545 [Triangularia verruculosa]|uniref:Rhodopsin n=1 Tax=Triangularia verruculosa TaxID=2587418 RepID=A0AAN6XEC4_9PEZI|nr:hypothetical protein QBC40DRAFT_255545 [Triangularia verruculosa]